MRNTFLTCLALLGFLAFGVMHSDARAQTPNVPVAVPGVVLVPLHFPGTFEASVESAAAFRLPFPARVLGVTATARASDGTGEELTVDVLMDGVSILDAPMDITAGEVAQGAIATPLLADESDITVDFDIDGTEPEWDDITVLITLIRI